MSETELRKRFFPDSLCHDCSAPPRFVTSDRGSTFLFCPVFKRYPPQPVRACEKFTPRLAPHPSRPAPGPDG